MCQTYGSNGPSARPENTRKFRVRAKLQIPDEATTKIVLTPSRQRAFDSRNEPLFQIVCQFRKTRWGYRGLPAGELGSEVCHDQEAKPQKSVA